MPGPDDPDAVLPPEDATLLAALGRALGPDESPAGLVDRAIELLAFADVDAELAALLTDAADQELAEPAGVRGGAPAPTLLTFGSDDGEVTVEIELGAGEVHGLVVGAAPATVELARADGSSVAAPVDALGRFSFTALPPGPARLVVPGPGATGTTVVTAWFVV